MVLAEIEAIIVESAVAKHFLDDIGSGLVEEETAVAGLGQKPQPRPDQQPMDLMLLPDANPLRFREDPVEGALGVVVALDRDPARAPDDGIVIDVLRTERLDPVLEQLAQPLGRVEPDEHEFVFAESCLQAGGAGTVLGRRRRMHGNPQDLPRESIGLRAGDPRVSRLEPGRGSWAGLRWGQQGGEIQVPCGRRLRAWLMKASSSGRPASGAR